MLEYKAGVYGTEIVVADRWFPSSKTCSECGHVKDKLSLSERTYECQVCGLAIDRDLNAARNLAPNYPGAPGDVKPVKKEALADGLPPVKLPSAKQESSGCQPAMVTV